MDSDGKTRPDLLGLERSAQPAMLRVIFNRLWPELRKGLRAGYSIAWLYRALREYRAWPGSYASLRAYVAAAAADDGVCHRIAARARLRGVSPATQAPEPPGSGPAEAQRPVATPLESSAEDVLARMFHPGAAGGPPRFKDPTE